MSWILIECESESDANSVPSPINAMFPSRVQALSISIAGVDVKESYFVCVTVANSDKSVTKGFRAGER